MRRLVACAIAACVGLTAGCGGNTAAPPDGATSTSTSTSRSTPSASSTTTPSSSSTSSTTIRQPIDADYEFSVTAAPGQLGPSGDREANAVYPGQALRLDFTNVTGTDNPCPAEATIEVTDAGGSVVAAATGFSIRLPDVLEGPLSITARCLRGDETGMGIWASIEVLESLELTLGSPRAEAGQSVGVMVAGGCPDGSIVRAALVAAEGAALGVNAELGLDGNGTLDIPAQLISQRLFVRAECTGARGAIGFAPLEIGSGLTEPWSEPIEYQPGVVLSVVQPAACDASRRPVMVTTNAGHAEEFAARGYVGVVVEARNPGNTSQLDAGTIRAVMSATNDLAVAVQWLRAHAAELCIASDAIAATGYSFWGISALALAYYEGELVEGDVITIDELGGSAVIGPAPPPPPAELAAFSNDINAVISFSGFALADTIEADEPPAILFHGRDDPTVPFALAEQTCAAAAAVGVTCELVPHDAGHGMADDIDAAWDTVVEFLEKEMLDPAGIALSN